MTHGTAERVIMVEDNPGDADIVRDLIGKRAGGFQLCHVERLEDAASELVANGVGCVLLDLSLPDAQGLEGLLALRRLRPDVPIVVLSGNGDEAVGYEAVQQGAQDYLVKGRIDDESLTRSIRYAIERKHGEETLARREAMFREAEEVGGSGSWEWDLATNRLTWSDNLYRIFGLEPGSFEPSLERYIERFVPDGREPIRSSLDRALEDRQPFEHEQLIVRPDGETRCLRCLGRATVVDGTVASIVGLTHDVTQRKRAEQTSEAQYAVSRALALSDTLEDAVTHVLSALGESMGWHFGAVWLSDPDEAVIRCRATWQPDEVATEKFADVTRKMSLRPGEGTPGRLWQQGVPQSVELLADEPEFKRHEAAEETGLQSWFGLPITSGTTVLGVVELLGRVPRRLDQRLFHAFTSIGAQIGEFLARRGAEQELAHRATHDALTGLPNRVLFLDRLAGALARAEENGSSTAVLLVDLDNFKTLNDVLGHRAADEVLKTVAARLQAPLRRGDTVARLGSDEFLVLCEDLAEDEARAAGLIAENLRDELRAAHVLDGERVLQTASVGIALATEESDAPTLLQQALAAGGAAKRAGRDRCEFFDPEAHNRAVTRIRLERTLRGAIDRGEVSVVYQPVVALETRQLRGFEALVRWQHPGLGPVSPAEFIPIAEESGFIVPLGLWVLEEACRAAASWPDSSAGAPLTLSVNLSPRQIHQDKLAASITSVVNRTGLDPRRLALEVTETVLMEQSETVLERLTELRALGLTLYLDDFGTGYSSLSYLKRYPINAVKIDRSFVSGFDTEPENRPIVEAVIGMARALGLTTIAEGVETESQAETLQKLGCPWAQGFYFARPMSAQQAAELAADPSRLAASSSSVTRLDRLQAKAS